VHCTGLGCSKFCAEVGAVAVETACHVLGAVAVVVLVALAMAGGKTVVALYDEVGATLWGGASCPRRA
jgi:hypothetical protein